MKSCDARYSFKVSLRSPHVSFDGCSVIKTPTHNVIYKPLLDIEHRLFKGFYIQRCGLHGVQKRSFTSSSKYHSYILFQIDVLGSHGSINRF